MRRENPTAVRPGLVPILAVAFLALPLQSCLKPTSVDCGPDLACPAGYRCSADHQICIKGNCGDGITQNGEACDDGNLDDGDGCNSTCESNETCDNGFVDTIKGEICDDGDNAAPGGCSIGCRSKETCGNGVIDAEEKCDDGNNSNEDNCLNDCIPALCGDGHVDRTEPHVEECDPGGETHDCDLDCTRPRCGDGIVNVSAGEQCDDGNDSNEDNCLNNCTSATCGDGYEDHEAPRIEACDPGKETDVCDLDCTRPECGDGIVNASAGEQCDDDNDSNEDNCLNNCTLATCGDGHEDHEAPRIETCDPGKETDVCDLDCTRPECGDGIVNASAGEECDFRSDPENCLTTCKKKPIICGDGNKEGDEACDDGNTDSCGTCNATCTQAQDAAVAIGEITAIRGTLINDGEILSISDGFKRLTFEFNRGDKPTVDSRRQIFFPPVDFDSKSEMASEITDAINASRGPRGFKITAHHDGEKVILKNDDKGGYGNKAIISSIESSDFKLKGMDQGRAYDCPVDMGCTRDRDCDISLGLKCKKDGEVRGTCQKP
ncbi:MAG TPA: DUF4215 domain-containing protein [Archangium sp.]|uniref:DUF4215 domain-containing protein n=1 Tax=Archangium sp. TaxID=1872627 RepID=UPI002E3149CD|nr:DUF4215 domain-containing protein [Archangium sp.]HEX5749382.1 DUF4215 domain-containing protein [Archangium sp.]